MWCPTQDSNLHVSRQMGLSHPCLHSTSRANGTGDGTRTRSGTVFKTGLFTIFNTPAFGIGLWIRTTTSSFGDCHATVTSSPHRSQPELHWDRCHGTLFTARVYCTTADGANPDPWSTRRDSNPQPAAYKAAALPIELREQVWSGSGTSRPRPKRGE